MGSYFQDTFPWKHVFYLRSRGQIKACISCSSLLLENSFIRWKTVSKFKFCVFHFIWTMGIKNLFQKKISFTSQKLMYRKDFTSGKLCPGTGFRFFLFQCNLSVMQESFVTPRDRGTPNICNSLPSVAVPLITFYGGRKEVFVTSAANLSCLSSRCSCPFSYIYKNIYILYLILMLL